MKWTTAFLSLAGMVILASQAAADPTGPDMLAATGVRGGLVVHVGCGDGQLTADLWAGPAYTVHGFTCSDQQLAQARQTIAQRGLAGKVFIDRLTGPKLPLADNLVNLLVGQDPGPVNRQEMMRVLAPGGVAYLKTEAGWQKQVKPFPDNIDHWSHFLHDAGNNAVAHDTVVGQPRHLQWQAPPLWLRSHETASGIQSQVAAGGRLFYIFDEGPIGITDPRLPERWVLVCRDAFNGKLLWKRPLPAWGWRQWARERFEGKDWTQLRAARLSAPVDTHLRLVAGDHRLYATLGYHAPLSILDAATGKTLATVPGTEPTLQILCSDGVVVALVGQLPGSPEQRRGIQPDVPARLVAADQATGKVLWNKPLKVALRPLMWAIADHKVLYLANNQMVACDLRTGRECWQAPAQTAGCRTFVAAEGAAVLMNASLLECHDLQDGRTRWQVKRTNNRTGEDLFVIDGAVYPGVMSARLEGKDGGAVTVGYDLLTGQPVRKIAVPNLRSPEHHHRCYRNKATCRFIITAMEGAEFLDLRDRDHGQNNWLRGACREGIMPAYGMLYVSPDQCFCEPGAKLLGYTAVAPATGPPLQPTADTRRLEKGPAWNSPLADPAGDDRLDWPTFRHDPARHGSTPASVGPHVRPAWRTRLGGRLSAPVAAAGLVLVAQIDRHTIVALDGRTGRTRWQFTAGGRVDSPPTVYRGRVLFGSHDGYVYCLRLADGALAWRFLAAPSDRRIVCFDQLESVWPVGGSVLMHKGLAYVAAGRSTYLDGGIHLYALDPASGRIRYRTVLSGPHRTIDGPRDVSFFVPGANADLLVSEGGCIYMRQKKLTERLEEVPVKYLTKKGEADVGLHVFSTAGLLDDSGYNRTFWMYAQRWPGFQLANQAPKAGQLLVVDEQKTYAVKQFYRRNVHSPMFFPGKEGYLLFADWNRTEPQIVGEPGARPPLAWLPQSDYSTARGNRMVKLSSKAFGLDKMVGYTRADPPVWMQWLAVRVRAMVKAGEVLFVAGPPDVYDPQDPFGALEGKHGAVLCAMSAQTGKPLVQTKLDATVVFDGMIATAGRLVLSLADGSVACLAGIAPEATAGRTGQARQAARSSGPDALADRIP